VLQSFPIRFEGMILSKFINERKLNITDKWWRFYCTNDSEKYELKKDFRVMQNIKQNANTDCLIFHLIKYKSNLSSFVDLTEFVDNN